MTQTSVNRQTIKQAGLLGIFGGGAAASLYQILEWFASDPEPWGLPFLFGAILLAGTSVALLGRMARTGQPLSRREKLAIWAVGGGLGLYILVSAVVLLYLSFSRP